MTIKNKNILRACIILFLIFGASSCVHESTGVFYSEMGAPPQIGIKGNILEVNVTNSVRNSAKSITILSLNVKQGKVITLEAKQSAFGKSKKKYTFNLNEYKIIKLKEYSIFWEDPNGKMNKIQLPDSLPLQSICNASKFQKK